MAKSGGSKANKTGAWLETVVSRLLVVKGYKKLTHAEFDEGKSGHEPVFSRQYLVGTSIYEAKRQCDFILYHPKLFPKCLVIECKWQATPGTVDEKYPYLVHCIERSKYDSFVVLDGGGYKEGAEQWIRKQAKKGGRLCRVFNLKEFKDYVKKGKMG